jgi:hypothetical protein
MLPACLSNKNYESSTKSCIIRAVTNHCALPFSVKMNKVNEKHIEYDNKSNYSKTQAYIYLSRCSFPNFTTHIYV